MPERFLLFYIKILTKFGGEGYNVERIYYISKLEKLTLGGDMFCDF